MTCPISHTWISFFRNFSSSSLPQPWRMAPEVNDILNKVHILSTHGHIKEALSLFCNTPPAPLHYSQQTYATLYHACARHGCLQEGQFLHQYMLSHNPNCLPDLFVTNHLINMYTKCGDLDYAHQLFNEMPKRNIVSWTALISGYAQNGRADECCSLFSDMLVHVRPNEFACASVLSSCEFEHGMQVHGLALKMALDANVYVGNALITMYSKCRGYTGVGNGVIDEAWTVFETMEFRNLVSWNSMIAGFQNHNFGEQAMSLFSQMHSDGIGFDRATLGSVFSSLSGSYGDKVYVGLNYCLQLHSLCIKSGFSMIIEVATGLVKAYSDLGGEVTSCYKLFLEISCSKDIVAWTGIITAFAECDPEGALSLFRLLLRGELFPDRYTFSVILKACAGLVSEIHALAVHSLVIKAGFEDGTVVANALIHAYARCGSLNLSKQVFDETRFRDVVSWNSMVKSYALYGQAKEALHLFSEMNIKPDSATMVALLTACSHAGLVEEGIGIFDSMLVKHGICPQLDHYACMVDILGRAGRVSEAMELVSRMPMEPDSVIWSALLGSSRKHRQTHLAKLAAHRLRVLEPENSLGYVQMANIYCSEGSFNESGLIRTEMKGSKVKKEPGLSWIEIGNMVHEFASGGRRHQQREVIYTKLDALIGQLKEIGYVPETSLVLHDIEEENKMQLLYHHSEKLALVYALINERDLHHGRSTIKIMKNIRICEDCHNFMKLASYLLGKEIVVRDSNRFHHFKNKICSCNDYW